MNRGATAPIPLTGPGDRVILGLDSVTLRRGTVVESAVGGTGRLKHVVVHPQTREVTGLVIVHEGSEWLVPVHEIATVAHNRVRLRGAWSRYQRRTFDRACFHSVSPSEVRATSDHGAAHGGSPLLDAGRAHVRIGASRAATPGQAAADAGSDGGQLPMLDEEQQRRLRELEEAGVIRVTRRTFTRLETIEVPVREERAEIELVASADTDNIPIGGEELWQGERLEVLLSSTRDAS